MRLTCHGRYRVFEAIASTVTFAECTYLGTHDKISCVHNFMNRQLHARPKEFHTCAAILCTEDRWNHHSIWLGLVCARIVLFIKATTKWRLRADHKLAKGVWSMGIGRSVHKIRRFCAHLYVQPFDTCTRWRVWWSSFSHMVPFIKDMPGQNTYANPQGSITSDCDTVTTGRSFGLRQCYTG